MPPKLVSGQKSYRTLRQEAEAKRQKQREYERASYHRRTEEQKEARRVRDRLWRREKRAKERAEIEAAKQVTDENEQARQRHREEVVLAAEEARKKEKIREQGRIRQQRYREKVIPLFICCKSLLVSYIFLKLCDVVICPWSVFKIYYVENKFNS